LNSPSFTSMATGMKKQNLWVKTGFVYGGGLHPGKFTWNPNRR